MTGSNSHDEEKPKRMIGEYSEDFLLKRAKEIVEDKTKDWEISNLKDEERSFGEKVRQEITCIDSLVDV